MPDTPPTNPLQNALLSSLISGQQGGLDLQSLLAAKAGGDRTGGLDLAALLAAQGGNDGEPGDDRLNVVLRWLEQRRATVAQDAPVEESASEAEMELQRLEEQRQQREQQDEQREQAHQLKRAMNGLYAELELLRARNDTLAAALGACYLCFGEDLTCSECGGHGVCGSLLPNAAAFRKYVAPAVHRVRTTNYQSRSRPSLPTAKEQQSQGSQPVSTA